MAVFFWYPVNFSSVHLYSSVRLISSFFQGTRKNGHVKLSPCISVRPKHLQTKLEASQVVYDGAESDKAAMEAFFTKVV